MSTCACYTLQVDTIMDRNGIETSKHHPVKSEQLFRAFVETTERQRTLAKASQYKSLSSELCSSYTNKPMKSALFLRILLRTMEPGRPTPPLSELQHLSELCTSLLFPVSCYISVHPFLGTATAFVSVLFALI